MSRVNGDRNQSVSAKRIEVTARAASRIEDAVTTLDKDGNPSGSAITLAEWKRCREKSDAVHVVGRLHHGGFVA